MSVSGSSVSHKGGRLKGVILVLFGLACIVFCVAVTSVQIQTTEALVLHNGNNGFAPAWDVFQQPAAFLQGKMSVVQTIAFILGFGVEFVALICVLGFEPAHHSTKASGKFWADAFMTGMIIIFIGNMIADYLFGPDLAFMARLGFTVVMSFVVLFFGVAGVAIIEYGIKHF